MWILCGIWGEFTCKHFFFLTLFTLRSYFQNWDYKAGMFFWGFFFFLSFQFWSSEMCVALLSSSVSSCTVFTWSAGASSCFLNTEREREKNTRGESVKSLWRVGWLAESLSASGGAGRQTHPGPSGTCWHRWAPAQDWSPGNRPLAPQTDLKHKICDSRRRRLARMIRCAGAWIALNRFFRASARCDLFNFESCVPFNMIPNQIPSMCKKHLTSISFFFPPLNYVSHRVDSCRSSCRLEKVPP